MDADLITLNRVSVTVHGAKILDEITFDIKAGSKWAIIGKSGAGKSALLKVIAGKLGINSGVLTSHFDTAEGAGRAEPLVSQRVSLIEARHHFKNFSNTSDFYYQQRFNSSDSDDAMTVEQYLSAVQVLSGNSHYWTLEKVVAKLSLTDLYHKEIIKLSNGETKRLRIAAALVRNPALLLLDQPLTGLDAASRQYFSQLMQEIAQSGITIIIATSPDHIPAVVEQVMVLDQGRVSKVIKPHEVAEQAQMIGASVPGLDDGEIRLLLNRGMHERFDWIIKMKSVNVQYGGFAILSNVNWQVKQGERWALLGPNGAGKSTLLSLAYGDNPQAYANDIVLFDKKRGTGESIWDIKRRCGFVSPELYQYFPTDQNCLQVVESGFYDTLGLFRLSEPSRADIALRWMKVLNINGYAKQLLSNIPASAQRLCLLARALVKNPALLILDEPCQGMDHQQQRHFKQVIDIICGHGDITLIYVTHYREEIPGAVGNYILLDKGKVADVMRLSV